jgi:hypothetical protein
MNTFAAYCDRDDLNVCKRAREIGDGTNWKLESSLKCRSCRRGRYVQGESVTPMSPLAPTGAAASTRAKCDFDSGYLMAREQSIARTVTHAGICKVRRARFRHAVTRASEITWSSECRSGWPFDPDQIADQLGIGVHRIVAFLLLSAYLFRTVFPWLFACHPTASDRYPSRVSAGCREST